MSNTGSGTRARPSSSPPRSPVTQSGEREIGEAQIRLRPPRSPVTYNPSPPSQDHAGHNHPEPKWVVDLFLYQADNQTERIWGSVRKRREGRGIFVRETKDMEGGSGRTEACWARERVER
uniref:Uncharacterized protein n=1 Tax=Fagus sylvatica TaxID=28930 RepID=A0A2N9FM98_FAGSY